MTKASWEGKVLFGLDFHSIVYHCRKSEQDLKQKLKQAKVGRRGAAYLLAPLCSLSLIPYRNQDYHSRGPEQQCARLFHINY